MKKILIFFLALITLSACKEDDVTVIPNLFVENTTITKEAQTITMPIVADMKVLNVTVDESGASWCSVEWTEDEIVATVKANRLIPRDVILTIEGEMRTVTTTLSQEGVNIDDFKEYDRSNWKVIGFCGEIVGDGGGAAAILKDGNDTFWHNNYGDSKDVLPHWIIIDMKEEINVEMVRLGWRKAGDNYYYNNKVTNIYIGNSPEHEKLLNNRVGSLTTIPTGKSHASKDHKEHHNIGIEPTKGRYLMLEVTESNNGQTSIIAYVKTYVYPN